MANSLTLNKYTDYFEIVTDGLTSKYRIMKSFCSDIAYADSIYYEAGVGTLTWDDRSVLQGTTYYYWVTETDGSTIVTGPVTGRITQPKLIGRGGGLRGAKRNKSLDYDVECELCGMPERRNVLRRGYVRPHETGRNYLPNAAAPENWDWGGVIFPAYYDANTWNWWSKEETNPPFTFPCIGQFSDHRTPPNQNDFVGCPVLTSGTTWSFEIGTPSSAHATTGGYAISWIYVSVPSVFTFQLKQGVTAVSSVTSLSTYTVGWHRIVHENVQWNAVTALSVVATDAANAGAIIFGGTMLTTDRDESSWIIPHRSSGLGVYTTGGMMNLCKECWSGLRKRVPWG